MPSPFPGMDPYVEAPEHWGDCHANMIAAMRGELNRLLPKGYVAKTDQYVWIHEPDAETRRRKPDVYVARRREGDSPTSPSATLGTSILLPAITVFGNKYLRIVDSRNRRLVTVIELLSPANKNPGIDRDGYLAKRNEYFATKVNLVEIDLLRGGRRLPLGSPPPAPSDYCVLVSRASDFPRAELITFGLRDPLPSVPIPLPRGEEQISLPLRPCLDRAYDEGRFETDLDYDAALAPKLSKEDRAWMRKILVTRSSQES